MYHHRKGATKGALCGGDREAAMAEGVGDHALARDRGLPHCSGQRRPGRVSALEHQWARPAHEGGRHVRQRAACLRLRFQVVTNPAIYYYYLLTSTNGSLAWMSW